MPFHFLLVFNIKPLERRHFHSIKQIKGEEISPLQCPDWFLSLIRAPLSKVLLGQGYLSDQISTSTLRYSFLGLGKSGSKAIRLHKYVFLSVANIDLSGFYFDTSGFQCLEWGSLKKRGKNTFQLKFSYFFSHGSRLYKTI